MRRFSSDEAFDERGLLRDGKSFRVKMGDSLSSLQRAVAAAARNKPRITDGYGNSGLNLQRPGFRLQQAQAHDTRQQQIVEDSYRAYDKRMTFAHRLHDGETLCSRCGGEGYINGEECEACNGEGTIDDDEQADNGGSGYGSTNEGGFDSRTVDRRSAEYDAYDNQLRDAWRGSK
jgi:hypothetical protein